jgi:GT2 family glycosyltransferase
MAGDAAAPTLSVVVVTFESRAWLARCLDALAAQDLDQPWEVLVVDNGSTDGTGEWLRRAHPGVTYVGLEQNLGFAQGATRGAAAASGEWLAFVNDDAAADARLLPGLLQTATRFEADAVAGRLLEADGAASEFAGGALSVFGLGFPYGASYPFTPELSEGSELPFACGGAMLVRRALFLELGGFDPDFFAYYEDVDFGWRLRLSGHRLVYAPAATVRHQGGVTASRFTEHWRQLHWNRNALLTLVKNAEHLERLLPGALALLFSRIAGFHSAHVAARERGDDAQAQRWLEAASGAAEGLVWVLDRWERVLEARGEVQARRRVSDRELHAAAAFTTEVGPPEQPENALAARLARLLDVEALLGAAARPGGDRAELAAQRSENAALRAELERLRGSWSWRVGEPLRRLIDRARRLAPGR